MSVIKVLARWVPFRAGREECVPADSPWPARGHHRSVSSRALPFARGLCPYFLFSQDTSLLDQGPP